MKERFDVQNTSKSETETIEDELGSAEIEATPEAQQEIAADQVLLNAAFDKLYDYEPISETVIAPPHEPVISI